MTKLQKRMSRLIKYFNLNEQSNGDIAQQIFRRAHDINDPIRERGLEKCDNQYKKNFIGYRSQENSRKRQLCFLLIQYGYLDALRKFYLSNISKCGPDKKCNEFIRGALISVTQQLKDVAYTINVRSKEWGIDLGSV